MITRIITVGPQRLGNLILSLHHDHLLDPRPNCTVIITPLPVQSVTDTISHSFPALNFVVIADDDLIVQYPGIAKWQDPKNFRAGWLKQQALKLAALDSIQSQVFLIQDPDTFLIAEYQYYDQGQLCHFVLPEQYHYQGYYQTLENVLGIKRQTTASFVTEFMPVLASDWYQCRERIRQTIQQDWTCIIDHVPLEPFGQHRMIRWFSEYELLGNWHRYLRSGKTMIQNRFVFNSLDTLNDLNTQYNAVCDRGIRGQIKGQPGLFSDHCDVDFDAINQALEIIRSKNIC